MELESMNKMIKFEEYNDDMQKEKGLFGEFTIQKKFQKDSITIGEILTELTDKQKILLIERLLDNINLSED
jgi:hypothetical protein